MKPEAAPAREETRKGMMLHCGGQYVPRAEVFGVRTPEHTATHFPLAHGALIAEIESHLEGAGFQIKAEGHALSHNGARYFGVLEVSNALRESASNIPGAPMPQAWVVGIRNSHDKTYPASLCAGTRVFVCDNLAFTGDVKLSRKHTRFAERDLKHLTSRAVGQLGDRFHKLDERVDAYRNTRLTDGRVHDILIRALDCQAISNVAIPVVLDAWRKPPHEEFAGRDAWSLFNAFTGVYKARGGAADAYVRRTEALYGLFDGVAGFGGKTIDADTGVVLPS